MFVRQFRMTGFRQESFAYDEIQNEMSRFVGQMPQNQVLRDFSHFRLCIPHWPSLPVQKVPDDISNIPGQRLRADAVSAEFFQQAFRPWNVPE